MEERHRGKGKLEEGGGKGLLEETLERGKLKEGEKRETGGGKELKYRTVIFNFIIME